jgi:hypothetical protein
VSQIGAAFYMGVMKPCDPVLPTHTQAPDGDGDPIPPEAPLAITPLGRELLRLAAGLPAVREDPSRPRRRFQVRPRHDEPDV